MRCMPASARMLVEPLPPRPPNGPRISCTGAPALLGGATFQVLIVVPRLSSTSSLVSAPGALAKYRSNSANCAGYSGSALDSGAVLLR